MIGIMIIVTQSFQVSLSQSIVLANKKTEQVGDYTKCFEIVEKLGVDIAEIVADVTSKNIPAVIVKAIESVKLTYEAIKCFEENSNLSKENLMVIFDEDKRQCYLEHLQGAMEKLVQFTQDLSNADTDKAVEDFQQMVDVLRDAQKNCQIILVQQLLTCLTMQKKLKSGNVKMIDRETLVVTVLGPKNEKGYYREKKLDLHCISFYDETKEQAFERMRELLVGQKVQFDDYKLKDGKKAADIFIDKRLVSYIMVSEGLASVCKSDSKPSKYLPDLNEGQTLAKSKNLGYHGDLPKQRKRKLKKLETFQDKVITGILELFNYELDFQFYSQETGLVKKFSYAGIKIPIVNKEHATNLKNFLSKNACQRESRFLIKEVISDDEVLVFDQGINENTSVLHQLLVKGWAKLDNNAAEELDNMELLCYKSLQEQAMNQKKRIWENYEGQTTQTVVIKEPEFEGLINEVISGDFFVVKSLKSKESYKVNLSNIRAPKCSTTKQDGEKWGDEAKEFMRKKYIGKKVYVKIDQIKNFQKDDNDITIISTTISYQNQSIGIELLELGLASFKTPRNNEQSSLAIKEYALASQQAQENKKGMYSNKDPVKRLYFDVTKQENKKKFKADFMLSEYKGYEEGVIDYVFSGSKFKIRFDKPKIYFMFTLNSIKTFGKNSNVESHLKWAEKATNFAKNNLMQRTVKFQIESVDKFGNGHGTLKVNGKNFAIPILQKGYGYVQRSYKPSEYYQKYLQLQEDAQKEKKGIWDVKEIVEELEGNQQEEEEKEVEQTEKKVQISECPDFDHIYLQEYGTKLNELTKKIKECIKDAKDVKEPLQKKTIVLGQFEKEYYRCKILNKAKDKYDVLFIDYGNRDKLSIKQMKSCPRELQKPKPLSFQATLDYIKLPPSQHNLGQDAFDMFMDLVYEKKLVAVVNSRYKGVRRIMLYQQGQSEEKESVNFKLMENGLALLDENGRRNKDELWIEANEKGLDKNPDLLNVIQEQEEY